MSENKTEITNESNEVIQPNPEGGMEAEIQEMLNPGVREVSHAEKLKNTLDEVNEMIESGNIPEVDSDGNIIPSEGVDTAPPEENAIQADSEVPEVNAEVNADAEPEESLEPTEEPVKTIALVSGEDTFEIPETAEIEVVVDGKSEKVKISDFRNSISGQIAINKRFSALDVQKKELDNRLNYWKEGETTFNQLLSEGKAKEALGFALQRAGVSVDDFYMQLSEEITPEVEQFLRMTPQERMARQQQIKEERYKQQLEATQNNYQRLQAKQEQSERVRNVQQKLGLDDASFVAAYDSLMREIQSGVIQLNSNEVTPETVGEYVQFVNLENSACKALEQVKPELLQNHRVVHEFVREGKRLADKGYQMDDAAFLELVSKVYGKEVPQPGGQETQVINEKAAPVQQKPIQNKQGHWMDQMMNEIDASGNVSEVTKKWGNR